MYELHGDGGGVPLLLLHGGLFDSDQQFGALLPGLSSGRRASMQRRSALTGPRDAPEPTERLLSLIN